MSTLQVTKDELKQLNHAVSEWIEQFENFDPEPGLEEETAALIVINRRLLGKIRKEIQ